jgi:methylglutamate dehydrogenase subunit B
MHRIHCPWCGLRDHDEFTLWGDASRAFPKLDAPREDWVRAVYHRANPRGETQEFFQHTLGCRRWLVVTRNNLTHEVLSVVPAHERRAAAASPEARA